VGLGHSGHAVVDIRQKSFFSLAQKEKVSMQTTADVQVTCFVKGLATINVIGDVDLKTTAPGMVVKFFGRPYGFRLQKILYPTFQ
jgi:hypothetical protein